jgi:hypothetical protein
MRIVIELKKKNPQWSEQPVQVDPCSRLRHHPSDDCQQPAPDPELAEVSWLSSITARTSSPDHLRTEEAEAQAHIEGLKRALDLLDAIITLIRASKNRRWRGPHDPVRVQRGPGQTSWKCACSV